MKLRNFFFASFILSTIAVTAQTGRLFNTDKKLSSSLINQIYQDRNGFIWIATGNGLNQYDGYQFRIFQKKQYTGNSNYSNIVNCVYQSQNGGMYIGLNDGLQYYSNDKFYNVTITDNKGKSIKCYINYFYELPDKKIIACTSGRGIFASHGLKATPIYNNIRSLDKIHKVLMDKKGILWCATTDKGIFAIKGKHLYKNAAIQGQKHNFYDICQDINGNIYVADLNGGMYKINIYGNKFTLSLIPSTANIPIASLKAETNGNILVGTNGMGLMRYNPNLNMFEPQKEYSNEINLSHGKVYSILEDREGNIWTGLLQKGVFMQPAWHNAFGYMGHRLGPDNTIGDACVMAVKKTKDGTLWIATDNDGLYSIDKKGKIKKHYIPRKGTMGLPATILCIEEDNNGRLWIGSFLDGCGWIDKNSSTYHRLPCTYGKANSIFDIKFDKDGNLWIGTMGDGIKCQNIKTDKIKEFHASDNRNSLTNDYIDQLSLSDDGKRIYVCTTSGLSCLDIASGNWIKNYGQKKLVGDIVVFDAKEDIRRGKIWACTPEGLYCIDMKTKKEKSYTTEDGLNSNNTTAIEIDDKANIWITTINGMNCINTSTGDISSFHIGDGLQGNEFCDGVACKTEKGEFIFGGMNGITWFYPEKIKQTKKQLQLFLTGFYAGGNDVIAGSQSGSYTITDSTVATTSRFDLGHQDNTFTITLSTLSYSNPENITYLYSINGDKWTRLESGKNAITLSHMPPGKYLFRVKAISNNSESNIREFIVKIHPAWYFSIWADIFYILLIMAAFRYYIKSRKRKEQDNLRLQEHIHAEELSEAKLKFFMNLSHEIRTPMTLIVAPLLQLIKEDTDTHRNGLYTTIKRNAERILHLINQMMDIRKIDKGQMHMHMKETDIVDFTTNIYKLFDQQAKAKKIKFTLTYDAENIPVWIDRANFDKVLMNILSNAFKFTSNGGQIDIAISHNTERIKIDISDDGEQISEENIKRIFERFYQSSSAINEQQPGTGIGLDLTRSLVQLHHGTISVCNNTTKGCTFSVCLPLGCNHLTQEEMAENVDNEDVSLYELFETNTNEGKDDDKIRSIDKPNNKPSILIVEDDDEIRTYLAHQLSKDYHIIQCINGKEGLTAALTHIPSLVISDIMMPEIDGNTLCAKLKSNINTNHIHIILLTAKNRDEDKLTSMETGADAYMVKPFNIEILRRMIMNLIASRKTLRNKFNGNESQKERLEELKIKSPDEKLLEKGMTVSNKNLSNEDLNVEFIANEVGISRVHLHRKIKELTNQTPHELIRNIRLKQAANQLACKRQSVADVMYACGFSNAASFSMMFKNMYGLSPTDYMKEHHNICNKS